MRSLKMTRNNSCGNILLPKKEKLNILSKYKNNDSSLGLISGSGKNIINASMLSETESSGEFEPPELIHVYLELIQIFID